MRTGEDLVAARQLEQLDAVLLEIVVLADLLERHPDVGQGRLRVERGQLLDGERTAGAEERGLKQLGERGHGRSPSARTRPVARGRSEPRLASSSSASRVERTSTIVGRGPSASSHPNCSRSSSSCSMRRVARLDVERPRHHPVQHRRRNGGDDAIDCLQHVEQLERERRRRQLRRGREVAARVLLRAALGRSAQPDGDLPDLLVLEQSAYELRPRVLPAIVLRVGAEAASAP